MAEKKQRRNRVTAQLKQGKLLLKSISGKTAKENSISVPPKQVKELRDLCRKNDYKGFRRHISNIGIVEKLQLDNSAFKAGLVENTGYDPICKVSAYALDKPEFDPALWTAQQRTKKVKGKKSVSKKSRAKK